MAYNGQGNGQGQGQEYGGHPMQDLPPGGSVSCQNIITTCLSLENRF